VQRVQALEDDLGDLPHGLLGKAPAGRDELVEGAQGHVLAQDAHRVALGGVPIGVTDLHEQVGVVKL